MFRVDVGCSSSTFYMSATEHFIFLLNVHIPSCVRAQMSNFGAPMQGWTRCSKHRMDPTSRANQVRVRVHPLPIQPAWHTHACRRVSGGGVGACDSPQVPSRPRGEGAPRRNFLLEASPPPPRPGVRPGGRSTQSIGSTIVLGPRNPRSGTMAKHPGELEHNGAYSSNRWRGDGRSTFQNVRHLKFKGPTCSGWNVQI